jgi:sugar phosphate isomerase/epimerase
LTPSLLATCWTTAGDAAPLEGCRLSPVPLHARIDAAARAGFTGFGIGHADLLAYLETSSLPQLRAHLSDRGMESLELEFLSDWWLPVGLRQASDDRLDFLTRAADALSARDVKIGADEEHDAYDLDPWAEQFHRVCDRFANVGAKVALEFTAFSNIPTLSAAIELVETVGHPNGGLMLDIWHLERGGYQLDDLAMTPLHVIHGVELNDGGAEQPGDPYLDTINNRVLPGQGTFDVVGFARTLATMGWRGPWGVEILSDKHRQQDLDKSLPEVYEATIALMDHAGIA